MKIDNNLLKEFAKITNDSTVTSSNDTVWYGTVVMNGKKAFVRIDGSDVLTPVVSAVGSEDGERVIVTIKDHTAMVTGNTTSPPTAVTEKKINEITEQVNESVYENLSDKFLTADSAVINKLDVGYETVKQIVIGNAEAQSILVQMLNAGTALIGDGTVDSLIAIQESVDKATILNLLTSKINVTSETGNLLIKDNTMQIKDNNGTVRVQIGLDGSDDYSMYVWDEAGNLMFDAKGITQNGIQRSIIRDDMVADDANISGKKIDLSSLTSELNNGNYKLQSSSIYYDGDTTLKTKFEEVTETINATAVYAGNYSALVEVTRDADKKKVTLACRVFLIEGRKQIEITDQYSDGDFQWYRMTDDAASDAIWNGNAYNGNSITLSEDDVAYGAKFICSVVAEKDKYIGTENKVAISWGGKILMAN